MKVWVFLAATIVIIIALMSWFSWNYSNNLSVDQTKNSINKNQLQQRVLTQTNGVSYYAIYVVNILTNHGI